MKTKTTFSEKFSPHWWKVVYLTALTFLSLGVKAQIITIGAGSVTGTTGSNIGPIYRSSAASAFDFSNQYYLYTATELAAAGIFPGSVITEIAWNHANALGTVATNNVSIWKVYMKNSATVPSATWCSTSFATQSTGATLVYNNTSQVIPLSTGYIPLLLSAPFTYTGGSLEIGSSWDCSLFAGNPTTGGFTWLQDPLSLQAFGGSNSTAAITMAAQTSRPQLRFTYTAGSPCAGTPTPGNTIASVNPACLGSAVTFSLQNFTLGSGVTYQWYNNAGAILNATNSTYTQTITGIDDLYCDVACGGGTPVSSSLASITIAGFLSCYCIPTTTNGCASSDHITNMTFNSFVNPYNNTTGACISGGSYSDYKTLTPISTVTEGDMVPISVSVANGGPEFAGAWIDYNQDGTLSAGEFIALTDADGLAPWIYNGTATIPYGTLGTTLLRVRSSYNAATAANSACATYSFGETEDYLITVNQNTSCVGTPNPGNTIVSASSVCPNGTVNLSLQNLTFGSGVTYQWYNNAGAILNATNSTYTATIVNSADDFYCDVACNAGTPVSSNLVTVSVNSFLNCYCTSNATFLADEEILNVTVGSLNNTSTCLTTGGPGSTLNAYSDYTTLVAAPTVSQLQSVPFSIQVGTCGGNFSSGVAIFIDYDHDGTFDSSPTSIERVFSSTALINGPFTATGNFTVPLSASTGITRMRVLNIEQTLLPVPSACGTYGYGETEDYLIDIIATTACSGAPTPGSTLASANPVCPNTVITLSLSTPPLTTGNTFQWFHSSGMLIPGATNATYAATIGTSPDDFYCEVSCNGGTPVASTSVLITLNNFMDCYCASIPTIAADEEIYNVQFGSGSTDPLYANANGCTTVAPGPNSILNRYSNFKTIPALASVTQGDNVPFTIEENECDGANFFSFGTAIWIDFNHSGSFEPAEQVFVENATAIGPRNVTGNITIDPLAMTGPTVMRIIVAENIAGAGLTPCLQYFYGETEDHIININMAIPCSGTPAPGNTLASVISICGSGSSNLSLSGQASLDGLSGLSYQWKNSGGNILNATSKTYNTGNINITETYSCDVTCANSGPSTGTSTTQTIVVNPLPIVNATGSLPGFCFGSTGVDLTAAGSVATYGWAPTLGLSSTTGALVTATPTGTTSYTVTATDGNNCSATSSVDVEVYALPDVFTATASPDTICLGASSILCASLPVVTSYCTPTYSTGTGFGDFCTLVSIATTTLNNPSGASPAPYYTLYPATGSTTATLMAGNTYTLTLGVGTFGSNDVAAWIDYNSNGVLDNAGEKLGEVDNIPGNATADIVFTVPTGANNGVARLRIREADQGTLGGMLPCDPPLISFGETEDYDITIMSSVTQLAYQWSPGPLSGACVTVMPGSTETYTCTATSSNGCVRTTTTTVHVEPITLNVKCFISCYWSGTAMKPAIHNRGCANTTTNDCDSLIVAIRDCTNPSTILFSQRVMLHVDGTFSPIILPNSLCGMSGYISITDSCQLLYTTSASCVNFKGGSVNYDFTTASSQAFGSNQKQIGPNSWGLYCGDFNQDCNIDPLDLSQQEVDIIGFVFGCYCTDLNGDGNVDILDSPDLEENVSNFIFCNNP